MKLLLRERSRHQRESFDQYFGTSLISAFLTPLCQIILFETGLLLALLTTVRERLFSEPEIKLDETLDIYQTAKISQAQIKAVGDSN